MGLFVTLLDSLSRSRDLYLQRTEVKAPAIPNRLNPTQRKLARMFMEHVPTHILDSGNGTDYGFQRDRKKPVWKQPESWPQFFYNGNSLSILLYMSTYHYLAQELVYDKRSDSQFQHWRYSLPNPENFPQWLSEFKHPINGTCYEFKGDYTYNHDNPFDHNFIFYTIDSDSLSQSLDPEEELVIIQIHNGCDARSGFTQPTLFHVRGYDYFYALPSSGSIYCDHCDARWDLECGLYSPEPADNSYDFLDRYTPENGEVGKQGTLVINKNEQAFCPVCGKGVLQ